jgi:hypothetical protein
MNSILSDGTRLDNRWERVELRVLIREADGVRHISRSAWKLGAFAVHASYERTYIKTITHIPTGGVVVCGRMTLAFARDFIELMVEELEGEDLEAMGVEEIQRTIKADGLVMMLVSAFQARPYGPTRHEQLTYDEPEKWWELEEEEDFEDVEWPVVISPAL